MERRLHGNGILIKKKERLNSIVILPTGTKRRTTQEMTMLMGLPEKAVRTQDLRTKKLSLRKVFIRQSMKN